MDLPTPAGNDAVPSLGWSFRARRRRTGWLIRARRTDRPGEEGPLRDEAGKPPPEKSLPARSPSLQSSAGGTARRGWREAGAALAGAVAGWVTPLLIGRFIPGGTVYEFAEELLCPLVACVGAGFGVLYGGAASGDQPPSGP